MIKKVKNKCYKIFVKVSLMFLFNIFKKEENFVLNYDEKICCMIVIIIVVSDVLCRLIVVEMNIWNFYLLRVFVVVILIIFFLLYLLRMVLLMILIEF